MENSRRCQVTPSPPEGLAQPALTRVPSPKLERGVAKGRGEGYLEHRAQVNDPETQLTLPTMTVTIGSSHRTLAASSEVLRAGAKGTTR